MTMDKIFTAYCDPGHGWAKVSKALLKELGIADKISSYSYQLGDNAYLEEDYDLTLFIDSYVSRYGVIPKFKDNYSDRTSKIRSYERYTHLTDEQEAEKAKIQRRMLNSKNWGTKAKNRIRNAGLEKLLYWQNVCGY